VLSILFFSNPASDVSKREMALSFHLYIRLFETSASIHRPVKLILGPIIAGQLLICIVVVYYDGVLCCPAYWLTAVDDVDNLIVHPRRGTRLKLPSKKGRHPFKVKLIKKGIVYDFI
jgi:hypothetical protein